VGELESGKWPPFITDTLASSFIGVESMSEFILEVAKPGLTCFQWGLFISVKEPYK
jgi:hypothetical protein